MKQGLRRGYTAAEKTELWDRWQRGEGLLGNSSGLNRVSSNTYRTM